MRAVSYVAVLVGLLLVSPSHAADAWPVPRGPSTEPEPYVVDVKKTNTIPKAFLDDASACILYAGCTYRLEADGTLQTIIHEVTRLNSRKSVEDLGEHRGISWDPAFEKVTLHHARIHKPDGRIIDAQPRDVQVRDVGTDYQVYNTDKHLVITFPTLGVSDILEVKWTTRGKNPEHRGHLFRRYSFGDSDHPLVRDDLHVLLPKDRPLKYACVFGDLKPTIQERDGERHYRWRAENRKPAPKGDGLPSSEELRPNVALSTFTRWEDVGQWKEQLRKACWECTPNVAKVVAEVTHGMTDPLQKAKALTHWMRQNIRYVSIGVGHYFTPHRPGIVLDNRYGDCKDGSQLLAVMLRQAGLKVELATLGVVGDGQVLPEVPSPWGTHAILVVTIDGKMHWIDTTSSLSGWDQLPRGDQGRMTYLVDDAGHIRLVRTPLSTPQENRYEQTTRLYVGNDGSTHFERTITAYGMMGRNLRDDLLEVPVGERRRKIASELQDSFSSARLLELIVDETALRDLDGPVKLKVIFAVEDHFRKASNDERDGSISDSKIWGRLLSWTFDYDRQVDFELSAPFESIHRFEVYLPPACTMDTVPRDRRLSSPWATFRLEVLPPEPDGPDLAFQMHTRLEKLRIRPADFEQFRDFQAEVNRGYRVWMTMKPLQDLADANRVEAYLHWLPEDGDAAAILARLYDRNGKKADARRVLKRSLAYAPKHRILLETAVELAGPIEEEEAAQRQLVQLYPTETRYQLDLAATLITRGRREDARKMLAPILKNGTPANRAEAHYQLARGHYRIDELKDAERELQAGEAIDPPSAERIRYRILQGQVADELGKPDDARKFFESALRLHDGATFPRESLVRLAIARKDTAEAMKHLRKLIVAGSPDFIESLAIAEYAFRLERYADAEEFARKAEAMSSSEKGRRLLGLLELKRGATEKAIAYLNRAGNDPIALEARITAHLRLGQIDAVVPVAEWAERRGADNLALITAVKRVRKLESRRDALLKLVPVSDRKNWTEAVGIVACVEEAAREIHATERARELTAKALKLAPQLGMARAWRAWLDLDQGKLSRAVGEAEAALQATPGYWLGHYVRGVVALEREKPNAVADLKEAARLSDEKDAPALLALARALLQVGKPGEARDKLEKAAALQPDLDELRPLLESLRGTSRP